MFLLFYFADDLVSEKMGKLKENNLVIDYIRDFFDAYFGKIEYGNIQEYIINNLPELT